MTLGLVLQVILWKVRTKMNEFVIKSIKKHLRYDKQRSATDVNPHSHSLA